MITLAIAGTVYLNPITMIFTGIIKSGVVILPAGVELPEGTEVRIETLDAPGAQGDDPFVTAAERLAKPRAHLPADYALNHGHYVRGEPKK